MRFACAVEKNLQNNIQSIVFRSDFILGLLPTDNFIIDFYTMISLLLP